MTDIAFFNGSFIPARDLMINATDLSIQRGYGIFDYFVAEEGKIIWFDDYMDRFYGSAMKAKMTVPYSREELKGFIFNLLDKNKKRKSGVKIILTGGYSDDGYTPSAKCNIIIFNLNFPAMDPSILTKGVNLIMDEYMRPNPTIKTLNYFNSVLSQDKMKVYNAIDVLYYFNNIVYETSRSNVFIIKDGKVVTKATGVLQGVTRKNVLRVVEQNYPLELRDFTLDELFSADEMFMTSSTKWILPVVKVEDKLINKGGVGPITKDLYKFYGEEVEQEFAQIGENKALG